MTVGSKVKGCFSSIKSAEATLELLSKKSTDNEAVNVYQEAFHMLNEVKDDLEKQVIFITNEEPQYK